MANPAIPTCKSLETFVSYYGDLEMTLIVSFRTMDGIVIAGDSLSTLSAELKPVLEQEVTCPECEHVQVVTTTIEQPLSFTASTFTYAQKVFPFLGKFGVGTFGAGQVANKTMHFAIRELEASLKKNKGGYTKVSAVAKKIGEYVHELLKQSVPGWQDAPEEWVLVGFQVVGYEESEARTIVVLVGKEVHFETHEHFGITINGVLDVVSAIGNLYESNQIIKPQYHLFSLQDAIEYAKFMIHTTAQYQQFANTIPNVGGDIDIGLTTPFDGFKWIQQKPLSRLIGQ